MRVLLKTVLSLAIVLFASTSTPCAASQQGSTRDAMPTDRSELDPRAAALLERAEAAERSEDFAGALQAYMQAVAIDKRAANLETIQRYSPSSYSLDAIQAVREVAYAAYAAALRQYLQLHPASRAALREWSSAAPLQDAEALLSPMLAAKPDDAELHELRGTARALASRYDDALSDLRRSAELDPNNPERHFLLGKVRYEVATKREDLTTPQKKELLHAALVALERAEKLREGYVESLSYRGLAMRAVASLETDPARQAEWTQRADAVREQAMALLTKRRTSN